ncbi:hypothetical protein ACET3Z_028186 [Daucus carota]
MSGKISDLKGFKEEEIYNSSAVSGFGGTLPQRDENGLPKLDFAVGNPYKDKMKDKVVEAEVSPPVVQVFDERSTPNPSVPKATVEKSESLPNANQSNPVEEQAPVKPSWSSVVKKGGDPLPESIKVAVLNVSTMELSADEFVDIEVSYPQRPMVCSGCKMLGHLVGACPSTKRIWVQKSSAETGDLPSIPVVPAVPVVPAEVASISVPSAIGDKRDSCSGDAPMSPPKNAPPEVVDNLASEEWTTVGGKKSSSHSTAQESFSKKLPVFTALSKTLSKGQTKKARRALGRGSPKKL